MSGQNLRALATASIAGGVCWLILAVTGILSPAQGSGRVELSGAGDYIGFGSFAAALLLTVPALLALHAHQRGADGRVGRIAVRVAMTGCAAQCVVISTILVTGEEPSWFGVAAPLAILTWFAGSVAFAVAIRRARVLPGWIAIVLPLVTAFAIVGSEGGTSVGIAAFLMVIGVQIRNATGEVARSGQAARAGVA